MNCGEDLIITGVKFTDRLLGVGAFARVFAVDFNGITCAAKQIHSVMLDDVCEPERDRIKHRFQQECLQHSKLDHPNIVKMLGVCYPNDQTILPVIVVELMDYTLSQLLYNYQNIPVYVKMSILQDVGRGLCYLHALNPPITYCYLDSNYILLTTNLVAKIGDVVAMKTVSSLSLSGVEPGTHEFKPPEALVDKPHYQLSYDVFSFGCVVCHVITQEWPTPSAATRKRTEVERRKRYIDRISDGSLKQLVIGCLDNDQERRPLMSLVSERITSIITG